MSKPNLRRTLRSGAIAVGWEKTVDQNHRDEFRRLLQWPKHRTAEVAFKAFVAEVAFLLNRWAALPDGDEAAVRVGEIKALAEQIASHAALLNDLFDPSTKDQRRLLVLENLLATENWDRREQLLAELDELRLALALVQEDLKAISPQHGNTSIATKDTKAELEHLFDEFVRHHALEGARNRTMLVGDRQEFVDVCITLARQRKAETPRRIP